MDEIIIEVDGIPCRWDNDPVDNIEFLEILADIEDGNQLRVVKAMRMVFGSEQYENIKDALRDENGVTKASDMVPFFYRAMEAAAKAKGAEAKNS